MLSRFGEGLSINKMLSSSGFFPNFPAGIILGSIENPQPTLLCSSQPARLAFLTPATQFPQFTGALNFE